MDRNDANQMFGSANVESVIQFKLPSDSSPGTVDFGDEPHLAGQPVGTAIICWALDGRVAVKGKLYSDNLRDPQTATVEIRFRRTNGRATNPTTRRLNTQGGWVSSKEVEKVSPFGSFNEVRIRLFRFLPDAPAGPVREMVASTIFKRGVP